MGGLSLAVTAFATTALWVGFLTDRAGGAKWGLVSIGLVTLAGAIAVRKLAGQTADTGERGVDLVG